MSSRRPGTEPVRSVLMIGSEAVPFAKTGGLADVLGALPGALGRQGWATTLVMPRYRGIDAGRLVTRRSVPLAGATLEVGFYEEPLGDRATVVFVDVPSLYDRDGLYSEADGDYPDNPRRFAVLSRAALLWAADQAQPPSVVHAHDWQAGLAPVYLRSLYAGHPTLDAVPSVFTIHNLAFQGTFDADWLPRVDLPWDLLTIERLEYWGRVSFLKGGINDADLITTVSRTYAREIQTPQFGFGFDGILRRRAADLTGVTNGIDTSQWDPAHDPYLPAPFDADDVTGKRAAKGELLRRYGLPTDASARSRPVIGMISRMVDQKGLDLIAALADMLPTLGATFVVLGTGEARYQDMWRSLAERYPDRIGARIGFSEPLAHLIEGGADLFLMPSQFEPCGLNQMYSLRYGTVPVVRAVGGLADTVVDYRPGRKGATGFTFTDYTPEGLLEALERALSLFAEPVAWQALQRSGMSQDNSWDRSAQEYVRIYRRALRRRQEPGRDNGRGKRADLHRQ